jgi:hypothetical protein
MMFACVVGWLLACPGLLLHHASASVPHRRCPCTTAPQVHGAQDEFCLRLMVDLLRIQNSKSEAPIEFVCPITFQVRWSQLQGQHRPGP